MLLALYNRSINKKTTALGGRKAIKSSRSYEIQENITCNKATKNIDVFSSDNSFSAKKPRKSEAILIQTSASTAPTASSSTSSIDINTTPLLMQHSKVKMYAISVHTY